MKSSLFIVFVAGNLVLQPLCMSLQTFMFKVQIKLRRYIKAVAYQETTICKCISEDAFEGSIVKDKHVTLSKVLHFMITTIQV